MLCCLGLLAGSALGAILGGPWTFIGPSVGFVVGLIGDTKSLHGFYKRHGIPADGCHGRGHAPHENIEGTAKDPVCGMSVNEKTSKHKTEFRGKTYYFCTSACESAFNQNPEIYVKN
ncbi:YHS domain-containing protein [Candidatus Bathyarchaeota archaeon]|nr:YHS domain-containing protein [Candidatus Bathyarchaeota archaeon]